jgi:hypothetical protein
LNVTHQFTLVVEATTAQLFFSLATNIAEKSILKTKSAKIKSFVSFSIAIIPPKIGKNRQIYITTFKCVAENIETTFLNSTFRCSL